MVRLAITISFYLLARILALSVFLSSASESLFGSSVSAVSPMASLNLWIFGICLESHPPHLKCFFTPISLGKGHCPVTDWHGFSCLDPQTHSAYCHKAFFHLICSESEWSSDSTAVFLTVLLTRPNLPSCKQAWWSCWSLDCSCPLLVVVIWLLLFLGDFTLISWWQLALLCLYRLLCPHRGSLKNVGGLR